MSPWKPNKPCRYPSCPRLVAPGTTYCAAHQRERDRERPTKQERGYTSKWATYAKAFLLANPTCIQCGAPAQVVDHRTPHKGNLELFWDSSNHAPMCKKCHDSKTSREGGKWG